MQLKILSLRILNFIGICHIYVKLALLIVHLQVMLIATEKLEKYGNADDATIFFRTTFKNYFTTIPIMIANSIPKRT